MNRSKHLIYIPILACVTFICTFSCKGGKDVIPTDVLSRIYYDMYMTDEAIQDNTGYRKMVDTLRIYEPVFNKYGYTTEDYTRTVNTYIERPDKFEKVFVRTKQLLEKREKELETILEAQGMFSRYMFPLDSIIMITADGIHAPVLYKNMRMLFFTPDTLVPVSPIPDSIFMARPRTPFAIFSDSAYNSDKRFDFYLTLGYIDDLMRMNSLSKDTTAIHAKPQADREEPQADKEEPTIINAPKRVQAASNFQRQTLDKNTL